MKDIKSMRQKMMSKWNEQSHIREHSRRRRKTFVLERLSKSTMKATSGQERKCRSKSQGKEVTVLAWEGCMCVCVWGRGGVSVATSFCP